MKLVNYGAGELTDRLTILALKLLFGVEAGKDIAHFKTERTALLGQIRARTLNGIWFERVLDLAAVNGALWHAEDDLREIRSHDPNGGLMEAAGRLGCRIQGLNDQRATLITQINKDAGDSEAREKP